MQRHIELLGLKATDKVTGLSGVITSVSFDLYGCIQAVLSPPAEKGEIPQGMWLDVPRLDIDKGKRVMPMPNFEAGYIAEGKKGPADKPLP